MFRPDGYPALSPYLILDEPEHTIAFAEALLGAERLRRIESEDGRVRHAEFRLGDAVVMIGGAMPGWPALAAHLHLYVPDVYAVFARALDLGAVAVQEPRQDGDPDYRGGFRDPGGVTWWIAQQTEEH